MSPLKENCSPRFSCHKGRTRNRHPDSHPAPASSGHACWPQGRRCSCPQEFRLRSGGGRDSPLQGLSSFSIPLHRNWSVTTSLTSFKSGNVVLSWETALIQLAHCNRGRTGEKDEMNSPKGYLAVARPGGAVTQGQMEKAARAGGGRDKERPSGSSHRGTIPPQHPRPEILTSVPVLRLMFILFPFKDTK